jgi:hypothetical protein
VRVDTANGYGSTGTRIRRFSNIRDNIGVDVEYLDSPTNGASFTVKSAGIYNISYTEVTSSESSGDFGISKNASNLTTNVQSLALSEVLALGATSTSVNNQNVSWQGYLLAGDIIRPHSDATLSGVTTTFTISKVGKPNVTGVNVTPFVNVNTFVNNEFNAYILETSGVYSLSSQNTSWVTGITKNGTGDVTVNFSAGLSTAPSIQASATGRNVTISSVTTSSARIQVLTAAGAASDAPFWLNISKMGVDFRESNDSILTPTESFSTDTASLQYAGSGTYTLSTLSNAPVGTYITFTYAANTNTRTQTTTRPTQTDADMNANGMLIYTRAYNAASTAAQPAVIAVQIGKGLKGKSLDLYKSAAKTTSGEIGFTVSGSSGQSGLYFNTYDEKTGILYVDSGATTTNTITSNTFFYTDTTNQTSGYLVINASKNPALTGVPLLQPRIATISDVKAANTTGGTFTSGAFQTRTLNTLDDPTGIITSLASNQVTLSKGEYYIEASAPARSTLAHQAKLRNITDSTDVIIGSSEQAWNASDHTTRSFVVGKIVISSPKVFELQHRCNTTGTFGFQANLTLPEVYSIMRITKIKD